jgi:glucokinase
VDAFKVCLNNSLSLGRTTLGQRSQRTSSKFLEGAEGQTMANRQTAMKEVFLGLDLGATKIVTALVDRQGQVIARDYRKTEASKGLTSVVARMVDAASEVMNGAGVVSGQIGGVGVAAPGPTDAESGIVRTPINLPGWKDVPLGQLIQDRLGLPTALENDANAAALAEHRFGAGRGTTHMIYVTVSTGIGGGVIVNRELVTGATGAAGEIGHMTILPYGPYCACGNRGCLEALASGTAIAREARMRVSRGVPTLIADLAKLDPKRISAKLVAQAAAEGDAEAQEILDEAVTYLGLGIANLANIFNPELIVVGGGLSKMGERLLEPVRRTLERRALPATAQAAKVVPAQLGDDVAVIGAATVAMRRSEMC